MIADGQSVQEIAFELGLKEETVYMHLRSLRNKLSAKSTAHAVWLYASKKLSCSKQ